MKWLLWLIVGLVVVTAALTGRLFCAVAKQSGIPKEVLVDGDVDICGN